MNMPFPVTIKQRAATPAAALYGFNPSDMAMGLSDTKEVRPYRLWETNVGTVFACVKKISNGLIGLGWELYDKRTDERINNMEKHPAYVVLMNPNRIFSEDRLFKSNQTYVEIGGNAYWLKVKNDSGIVKMIWPLHPRYMRVVPSETEIIGGYKFDRNGKRVPLKAEDIVHFKGEINTEDPFYGMGTVEAARYEIDSEKYLIEYEKNLYKNKGFIAGVLTHERPITLTDRNVIVKEMKRLFGGLRNVAKLLVLGKGAKYQPIALSPVDADFVNTKGMTKADIWGMFGLSEFDMGQTKGTSRANADANEYMFSKYVLLPKARSQAETITQFYCSEWDENLAFRFINVIPRDKDFDLTIRDSDLEHYVISINEVREARGDEKSSWGDVPIASMTMGPLFVGGGSGNDNQKALAVREAENMREIQWKRYYYAGMQPIEQRLAEETRKEFRRQGKEVLAKVEDLFGKGANIKPIVASFMPDVKDIKVSASALEIWGTQEKDIQVIQWGMAIKAVADIVMFDLEKARENVAETVEIHTKASVIEMANVVQEQIGDAALIEGITPPMSQYLQEQAMKSSLIINETTEQQLRDTLMKGVDLGETPTELRERVSHVFDDVGNSRAMNIARTEVTTSSNWSAEQYYRDSGVVIGSEWLTAIDGRERESHAAVNGIRIPLGETFNVGGHSARYPGDTNLPVEERANCRCTKVPILVGEEI